MSAKHWSKYFLFSFATLTDRTWEYSKVLAYSEFVAINISLPSFEDIYVMNVLIL